MSAVTLDIDILPSKYFNLSTIETMTAVGCPVMGGLINSFNAPYK
jgi:hypothetical protein